MVQDLKITHTHTHTHTLGSLPRKTSHPSKWAEKASKEINPVGWGGQTRLSKQTTKASHDWAPMSAQQGHPSQHTCPGKLTFVDAISFLHRMKENAW